MYCNGGMFGNVFISVPLGGQYPSAKSSTSLTVNLQWYNSVDLNQLPNQIHNILQKIQSLQKIIHVNIMRFQSDLSDVRSYLMRKVT